MWQRKALSLMVAKGSKLELEGAWDMESLRISPTSHHLSISPPNSNLSMSEPIDEVKYS